VTRASVSTWRSWPTSLLKSLRYANWGLSRLRHTCCPSAHSFMNYYLPLQMAKRKAEELEDFQGPAGLPPTPHCARFS
jgi:hypothetical protein